MWRMLRRQPWASAYATKEEDVGDVEGASFAQACAFVSCAAELGLHTTGSCVKPGTDVAVVRQLARALGAVEFKERLFIGQPPI